MVVSFAPMRAASSHRNQPQAYSTAPPSCPCYSYSIVAELLELLLSYRCWRLLLFTCLPFFQHNYYYQTASFASQRDTNNNNNINNTILPTDAASRRLLWDPVISDIAVWEAFNGDASTSLECTIAELDHLCCHSQSAAVASLHLPCDPSSPSHTRKESTASTMTLPSTTTAESKCCCVLNLTVIRVESLNTAVDSLILPASPVYKHTIKSLPTAIDTPVAISTTVTVADSSTSPLNFKVVHPAFDLTVTFAFKSVPFASLNIVLCLTVKSTVPACPEKPSN